jgi:3-deoxy-D-manno-octulosonic acid kinase
VIIERFLPVARGGILYDAARLRKPEAALFTREHWAARDALEEFAGGRGSVCALRTEQGDWILRHYRRGGFAARISHDRYLWLGASATRSFREWRLLAELHRQGLPVPSPIAARFERQGLSYRADIITARLPNSRTLAKAIETEPLEPSTWQQIGRTIAQFHAAGVHHADLNAHNIMLVDEAVYWIDFDRGRVRARGSWEGEVVARLRRSLRKVKAQRPQSHFAEGDWQSLLQGISAPARPLARATNGL